MRLSASRSCLVAGAKPRRVLPRAEQSPRVSNRWRSSGGVETNELPLAPRDATQTRVWVAITFSLELSHVTTCWVAKESTRLKHAAEKLVGRHALSPDSAPSPREPPLRRAVATTPARPRAPVPRRARRALAATSARAHRCPSIGRPSRG